MTTDKDIAREDSRSLLVWPWRIALAVETPALIAAISEPLRDLNAIWAFHVPATTPCLEVANLVEREHPQILFVELARIEGAAAEWIRNVRGHHDAPLIVAVHPDPDPRTMIDALRAGASEFLSLPMSPALQEAMDRLATLLESRQAGSDERGKVTGILSAKGGCGATTLACHLGSALQSVPGAGKILVADLDWQCPAAHRVFRVSPASRLSDALQNVRRLNSACWPGFVAPVSRGLDLLAGSPPKADETAPAEPWRTDGLFRFLARNYSWVLADLGRQLNPQNWGYLQHLDELIVVTAPDVLALYQTRSIMQTLTSRGFEKGRLRLVLDRNHAAPRDFWVQSIEQMFEMNILSVIPEDAALEKLPREQFEFPTQSAFGRAVTKLAAKLNRPSGSDQKGQARKAA